MQIASCSPAILAQLANEFRGPAANAGVDLIEDIGRLFFTAAKRFQDQHQAGQLAAGSHLGQGPGLLTGLELK